VQKKTHQTKRKHGVPDLHRSDLNKHSGNASSFSFSSGLNTKLFRDFVNESGTVTQWHRQILTDVSDVLQLQSTITINRDKGGDTRALAWAFDKTQDQDQDKTQQHNVHAADFTTNNPS